MPATLIARADAVAAGRIAIGGEDCSAAIEGSMTGDMSAEMLKDAGASAVILGHSERRHLHGETNADVAAKAKAAWRGGFMAIICIGDTAAQRAAGPTHAICAEQIAGSVPSAMNGATTAIAHEPLWAIGTGRNPDRTGNSRRAGAYTRLSRGSFRRRRQRGAYPLWRVGQAGQCGGDPGVA